MKKKKDSDQDTKKKKETDYRILLLIGIAWFPIGLVFQTWELYIVGMIIFILGLASNERWDHF